ncbi:MAG: hypothetical protein ACREKL_08570 [Chthoniobacterales bacterium]
MARRKRSKKTKLRASLVAGVPGTVPKRWVKFIVGLFLVPPAWLLTQTFFTAFTRAAFHEAFWATQEFWFFSLGLIIWLVAFLGLPRPLWIYVFGHELTHALWVMLQGGKVSEFKITKHGGHILSDRINTWIALAPYFFPIYSLLVIALYGLAGLFWDMAPFRPVLYMLIGATWGFHLSFTLWMIPRGQTDLTYGGTFFSLVLIYILNLAVLAVFLIVASPGVTLGGFGRELIANAAELAHATLRILQALKF